MILRDNNIYISISLAVIIWLLDLSTIACLCYFLSQYTSLLVSILSYSASTCTVVSSDGATSIPVSTLIISSTCCFPYYTCYHIFSFIIIRFNHRNILVLLCWIFSGKSLFCLFSSVFAGPTLVYLFQQSVFFNSVTVLFPPVLR